MTDNAPRKALEAVLDDQHAELIAVIPAEYVATFLDPAKVPIKWENYAWGREEEEQQIYMRPTYSAGDGRYPELGRKSRKDIAGELLIGIYTPAGSGTDLPGLLASVLALAYPYGSELVTDAGTVEITGFAKRRGAGTPDGRWYTPVHVNFMIWRSR